MPSPALELAGPVCLPDWPPVPASCSGPAACTSPSPPARRADRRSPRSSHAGGRSVRAARRRPLTSLRPPSISVSIRAVASDQVVRLLGGWSGWFDWLCIRRGIRTKPTTRLGSQKPERSQSQGGRQSQTRKRRRHGVSSFEMTGNSEHDRLDDQAKPHTRQTIGTGSCATTPVRDHTASRGLITPGRLKSARPLAISTHVKAALLAKGDQATITRARLTDLQWMTLHAHRPLRWEYRDGFSNRDRSAAPWPGCWASSRSWRSCTCRERMQLPNQAETQPDHGAGAGYDPRQAPGTGLAVVLERKIE